MKKTALTYALETIEQYSNTSILNPKNQKRMSFNDDHAQWIDQLERMSIQIKLDTILERLPYEIDKGVDNV